MHTVHAGTPLQYTHDMSNEQSYNVQHEWYLLRSILYIFIIIFIS